MKQLRQELHKCNRAEIMEEYIIKQGSFFPLSPANGRATKREKQSLKITDQAYEKWKQTEEINNFPYNQNNVFKIHNRFKNENNKGRKVSRDHSFFLKYQKPQILCMFGKRPFQEKAL